MTDPRKKREEAYNLNWEAEIAAYDAECSTRDAEFNKTHLVIKNSGSSDLTEDEQVVFDLVLKGSTCSEIAENFGVEVELITGLLEIIRAKLSLSDT